MKFYQKGSLLVMLAAALTSCEKEEEIVDDKVGCEDFKVESHKHSCSSFTFESNVDQVFWSVNGESLLSTNGTVDFVADAPGVYVVEANYENADCPQGALEEFEIIVDEECFDEDLNDLDDLDDDINDELDDLDDLDDMDEDIDEDIDEIISEDLE